LADLWSIFDFVNPGLLGTSKEFASFARRLGDRAHGSYGPLRELVRPYILRRLKTDKTVISDLPDKTEIKAFDPAPKSLLKRVSDPKKPQDLRPLIGEIGTRITRFSPQVDNVTAACRTVELKPRAFADYTRIRGIPAQPCCQCASAAAPFFIHNRFEKEVAAEADAGIVKST
jgi:hypothetical protein